MFNVTVLKMKDIKKYLIGMLAIIVIIILISRYFLQINNEQKRIPKIVLENSMIGCLEQTIPTISMTEEDKQEIIKQENFLQAVLKTQISSMQSIENIEEKKEKEEKEEAVQEEPKMEVASTEVNTKVITNNPIKETYHTEYGKVKIKNETEYPLTKDMLTPDIQIENKNIVLFHTHSCESYTASKSYSYNPTGNFRTTDLNYTVTRVGTELENQLKQYNYHVVHDTGYHDYPAYNGSYTRSLATV